MKYLLNVMDLVIEIDAKYDRLTRRIQAYLTENTDHIDISINLKEGILTKGLKENPHLSLSELEYIFTSIIFYREILKFNGFVIHSSAVVVDDKVYAFSAKSGTGKSTHTKLYLKRFKGSYIINDDKPAYRYIDGKFKVFGTPWSGKDDLSVNRGVDLQGLCFIKRGTTNEIYRLEKKEAISKVIQQTMLPTKKENLVLLLDLLDKFIRLYPVSEICCDMSTEAAEISYEYMKGNTSHDS